MGVVSYNPRLKDYKILSNYALGAGVVPAYNILENISGGALFTVGLTGLQQAYKGGNWLIKNKGKYSSAWQDIIQARNLRTAEEQALKGNNLFETVRNRMGNNSLKALEMKLAEYKLPPANEFNTLTPKQQLKLKNKAIKSDYYKEVRELIAKAKGKKGAELKSYLRQIDDAMAKAELNIHRAKVSGEIVPTTRRGKALAAAKKYSGYNKLSGKVAEKAVTSQGARTLAKGIKGVKGNALFTLAATAVEVPELIKTFNECGSKRGWKQVGKTATIVAAETAGYAAGAAGGAAIGAAIGTAGCPVVGTIIGAVCGIAVSCLTGWLARKAVGKSELEKKKEEDAKKLTQLSKEDPEIKKALLIESAKRLNNAESTDKEAQEALKAYEKLLKQAEQEELKIQENNEEKIEVLGMLENFQNFCKTA